MVYIPGTRRGLSAMKLGGLSLGLGIAMAVMSNIRPVYESGWWNQLMGNPPLLYDFIDGLLIVVGIPVLCIGIVQYIVLRRR